MDREQAWNIVCAYVQSESLRKHMLAVEACMRAYARYYQADVEEWGVIGLLHDFDYEIHPTLDKHPLEGSPLLRERGVPEDIIESILSHADYLLDRYPRKQLRDKVLAAVDELSGLCTAVALVRPSKSILEVTVSSVKKKWKDAAFARGVNRQDIETYTRDLGIPLEEHIQRVLEALQKNADTLGLRGSFSS